MGNSHSRGAIQMVDALMACIMVVVMVITAPIWWKFTGMVSASADPFSRLLLQLFIPMVLLAILISIAVSARRLT